VSVCQQFALAAPALQAWKSAYCPQQYIAQPDPDSELHPAASDAGGMLSVLLLPTSG